MGKGARGMHRAAGRLLAAFLTLSLALSLMPASNVALALDEALPEAQESAQEPPAAPAETEEAVVEETDPANEKNADDEASGEEAAGEEAAGDEVAEDEPDDAIEAEAEGVDAGETEAVDEPAAEPNPSDTAAELAEDPAAEATTPDLAHHPDPAPVEDPAPRTFTVTAPDDVAYDGQPHQQPVTVTDATDSEPATLAENTDYTLTYTDDLTNAGEVTVTVEGLGAYAGTTATCTYRIVPRAVTIASASAAKVYDGTALTAPTVVLDDEVLAAEATVTATGTITNVGTAPNNIEVTGATDAFNANNYELTLEPGTLTVTPAPQASAPTPTPADKSETLDVDARTIKALYDGTAHTVTATPDVDGTTFEYGTANLDAIDPAVVASIAAGIDPADPTSIGTAVANALPGIDPAAILDLVTWSPTAPSLTDAGAVPFVIRALNPNYLPATSDLWLLVVRPRMVTLASDSASKVFDGTELTAPNVTVTGDGWAEGETVTYHFTGTQTAAGVSQNTFTYDLPAADKNPLPVPAMEALTLMGKLIEGLGSAELEAEAQALMDELANAADAASAEAAVHAFTAKVVKAAEAFGADPDVQVLLAKLGEYVAAGPSNYLVNVRYGTLEVKAAPMPVVPTPTATTPVVPQISALGLVAPVAPAALAAVPTLPPAPVIVEPVAKPTPKAPVAAEVAPVTEPGLVPDFFEPGLGEHWSAANLVIALVSLVLSGFALGSQHGNKNRTSTSEDGANDTRKWIQAGLTVAPAAAAAASFLLTGDLSKPMQLVDRWTPLLVVLLVMQALALVLTREQEEDDPTDDATP